MRRVLGWVLMVVGGRLERRTSISGADDAREGRDLSPTSNSDETPVMSRPSPPAGVREWVVHRDWFGPSGLPILAAAVGGILYIALRIAATRYYGSFGLSPEDVGLGYVDLLVQSAAAALGFVVLAAAFVGGLYITSLHTPFLVRLVSWLGRGSPARRIGKVVQALAGLAVGLVALSLLTMLPAESADWPLQLLGASITWIGIASLMRFVRENPDSFGGRWLLYAVVPLGVIAFVTTQFWSHAALDADEVRAGRVPGSSFENVSLFPWGASIATVSWPPGTEGSDATEQCVLYLGRSESAAAVYEPERGRVWFVVAQDALVLDPIASRCENGKVARAP